MKRRWGVGAAAENNEIDPLLYPAQVAKLLGVSHSWLAKSRLNGTGPRFIKIGRAVRYALHPCGGDRAQFEKAAISPSPRCGNPSCGVTPTKRRSRANKPSTNWP